MIIVWNQGAQDQTGQAATGHVWNWSGPAGAAEATTPHTISGTWEVPSRAGTWEVPGRAGTWEVPSRTGTWEVPE